MEAVIVISQLQQQRANPEICIPCMKAWWNWQQNSKFNRASRAGKQRDHGNIPADTPCQYSKKAIYLSFMDHLLQGMNTQLLEAQDCYMAQYIIWKQLVLLTPERTVQL